ncbi:hypothetical protein EDB19DRAFT_1901544 [Suillus lakei]|nr:hypothetical protein EDB19DRAFT_1901544 [Suillus lakei]
MPWDNPNGLVTNENCEVTQNLLEHSPTSANYTAFLLSIPALIYPSTPLSQSSARPWEKLSHVTVLGAEYDSPERQPHPKCLEGTQVDLLQFIHGLLDKREKSQIVWLHGTAAPTSANYAAFLLSIPALIYPSTPRELPSQ